MKKHHWILIGILAVALVLRMIHWLDVRQDPFFNQLIMDSFEYDRWAREIAGGDWLGKEVFFQAPLYPYFLAVIYFLLGRLLDVVYLAQILLAVAGIYALYRAGRRLGGEIVGLSAAGISALYGPYLFYDVQILKESLAITCVSFLLWMVIEARKSGLLRYWAAAGIFCGLMTLLRENMMLVVPFLFIPAFRREERIWKGAFRSAALVLGFIFVLLPVALRNWRVGGVFAPTTFQGGVNFYIGNNPEASGTYQSIVPGKQMPVYERREPARIAEQETGRRLDAMEVSRFWLNKSLDWVRRHPGDYLRLQVKKFGMFWSWYEWPDAVDYYYIRRTSFILGLPLLSFGTICLLALAGFPAVRRRIMEYSPVWVFIAGWTASTVAFFLFSRYRLPVVPALILLAAAALSAGVDLWKKRKSLRIPVIGTLVLITALPHFMGYAPKMDVVHYNLGLIHAKEGSQDKAEQHYRQALEHNPDDFLSCTNLGNMAFSAGRLKEALKLYRRAVWIRPDSDGARSNLGGAYVALGDYQKAELHFDKALAINPSNIAALHNKSILLANRGMFRDAADLNRRVLQLQPRWEPALRLRGRLEKTGKNYE